MRREIKKIVKKLPGSFSYCKCETPCSQLTVEHLLPIKLLKNKIKSKNTLNEAKNDMYNLYSCCQKINQAKAAKIFGKDFHHNELEGPFSRSCLYMNNKYKLNLDSNIVEKWKFMSNNSPPFNFEKHRAFVIQTCSFKTNHYIESFNETDFLKTNIQFD